MGGADTARLLRPISRAIYARASRLALQHARGVVHDEVETAGNRSRPSPSAVTTPRPPSPNLATRSKSRRLAPAGRACPRFAVGRVACNKSS